MKKPLRARVSYLEERVETLENLILHQEAKLHGYAMLKKHLNRPDRPLPIFKGKRIKQD